MFFVFKIFQKLLLLVDNCAFWWNRGTTMTHLTLCSHRLPDCKRKTRLSRGSSLSDCTGGHSEPTELKARTTPCVRKTNVLGEPGTGLPPRTEGSPWWETGSGFDVTVRRVGVFEWMWDVRMNQDLNALAWGNWQWGWIMEVVAFLINRNPPEECWLYSSICQ